MITLKRKLMVLGLAAVMALGFTACAKSEPAQSSQADASASTSASAEQAEGDKMYFEINGYKLKIGETFEDVKANLGKEIKPAEDIGACDPQGRSDFNYFYDGADVTVHFDGKVTRIYVDEENKGAATFAGISLGDTADKVKQVLGTPDSEDEIGLSYMKGKSSVDIHMENGVVISIDLCDPETM